MLAIAASIACAARAEPMLIGRKDDGKVVALKAGRPLVLELEGNPTTGFDWVLEPGAEALGKPVERWVGPGEKEGAGAVKRFEWATAGAVPGTYQVRIAYRRRTEQKPPLEVFGFTLRVEAG